MTAPTLNKHLQMVNTEPFWPKRAHMSASWAHKRPYGSVWAHMGPARAHNVHEIILEIHVPRRKERTAQVFEKSAGWDGDFADASVAMQLCFDGMSITAARISLGAVAPLPMRAVATEQAIMVGDLSDTHIRVAAEKAVRGALPLSGNRYKTNLLVNLTERAIHRCLSEKEVT